MGDLGFRDLGFGDLRVKGPGFRDVGFTRIINVFGGLKQITFYSLGTVVSRVFPSKMLLNCLQGFENF